MNRHQIREFEPNKYGTVNPQVPGSSPGRGARRHKGFSGFFKSLSVRKSGVSPQLFILAALLLTACGGNSDPQPQQRIASTTTASFIQKGAVWPQGGESTPIVWKGDLLYVMTHTDSAGIHNRIYRQSDRVLLADNLSGIGFISALVNGGTLYVFGSAGSDGRGTTVISMTSTTDLVSWTIPTVIYTAPPGTLLYNTSVAPDPTGWVMAYEVCEIGNICFNARFLHSTDLVNWSPIGGVYEYGYYTACPTIRWANGYYYVFYLSRYPPANKGGQSYYATNVSRSADLRNWEFSQTTVLSPLDGGDASWNASDMDFVEFGGQVRIIYGNGSQFGQVLPNTGTREALFNGTEQQFLEGFF